MNKPKREKVYSVIVDGFDAVRFTGQTTSVARMKCFRALREAGYRYTFKDFLRKATTLHHGPVNAP